MNTNKRGLKRATRQTALAISSAVLREPKLTKAEKVKAEHAWKIEIRRRIAEIKAGKAKCIPAEEAMRNAYRALDRMMQRTNKTAGMCL